MAQNRFFKYKTDYSLFLLFGDKVLSNIAEEYQIRKDRILCLLWVFHVNRYIFKHNHIDVVNTVKYFDAIHVPWGRKYIEKVLSLLEERGYPCKQGRHYMANGNYAIFVRAIARNFTELIIDFDRAVEENKVAFKKPKRKYNKRKVGRPKTKRRRRYAVSKKRTSRHILTEGVSGDMQES